MSHKSRTIVNQHTHGKLLITTIDLKISCHINVYFLPVQGYRGQLTFAQVPNKSPDSSCSVIAPSTAERCVKNNAYLVRFSSVNIAKIKKSFFFSFWWNNFMFQTQDKLILNDTF